MRRELLTPLLTLVCVFGCSSSDEPGEDGGADVVSIFAVPESLDQLAEETFFDQPWPSDLRREADGTVRFEGFPNPRLQPILVDYVGSMKGVLDGFSPAASGFLRFSDALDESSLPTTPLEALDPNSAIQLIDIDPSSPEYGQRHRITIYFRAEEGVYWQPNTLAFIPTFGYPLRPHTRYAAVVTDAVRAADGSRVGRAAELDQLLGNASRNARVQAAADQVGDAIDEIESAGIARGDIVHLTVFTTNDPTEEARALRDWVVDGYTAPTARNWQATDQVAGVMDVYEGTYGPSPDFQRGSIPFTSYGDGGELAFDESGAPELQREFDLRFALAVPDATACPMPAAGYPIVLYAHGTGGDYRSMLGSRSEAQALARECIATMGIDQIFHGTRPGGRCDLLPPGEPCNNNVEIIFFNVQNPTAARANGPQSAIDVVQQARLFTESATTVPASVSHTGSEILFDASKLMFFGHSQGGLNGPMYLAIDDSARGAALSGSGSLISITLLEKTKPVDVAGLVKLVFLGLRQTEVDELNSLHPAMSLAQTIVDTTDPIHYVPLIAREPRPGFSPKSVIMTEGVNPDFTGDNYTPPHAIEVQATAMGLPLMQPVIHPVEEMQWSDELAQPVSVPAEGLSGNLAGGQASGLLAQWPANQASDGHFVIYGIPAAMAQCSGHLRNLADNPVGRVPAP